ncbi:MAG: hypothetical protein WHT29_11445 [Bacteroidales bacterium]|nr:hypothetical protein [Bacteroidales bacterium]HPO66265.1 hypothetical protein [Bacteroidales bacterium]
MKTKEENYAEVSYNPFLHAVVVKWKDVDTLNECQLALNAVIETLMCFNSKKVISDFSFGKTFSGVVTDWMKVEFIPKLMSNGVRKLALLVENANMSSYFRQKLSKDANSMGEVLKLFYNRSEMEGWLRDYELIPKPALQNVEDAARFGYFL